jgi:tRNA(Ile)-lysidine synthetase-like protein
MHMAVDSSRFTGYITDHRHLDEAVAEMIARHQLLHAVTRLGIAVSGGADSVALLHLLLPECRVRGIAPTVLHLNHGLRAEADEEARFVEALAADAGVSFVSRRVALAERPADGRSLEMAARDARLDFFRHAYEECALNALATGHHADDVAETLLMRLTRGSGAAGLAGLRPHTHLDGCRMVRPLLAISGAALRAWLRERGLTWCEDASNRDPAIPRNAVRHVVLPYLETTWSADLRARLCQSAETLREDDALLDTLARQRFAALAADDGALPVDDLLREPLALQRRMLRLWLYRHASSDAAGFSTVQRLLTLCRESGDWRTTLRGATVVECRNRRLSFQQQPSECAAPLPAVLTVPTTQPLRWGAFEITATHDTGIFSLANGVGHFPAACTLSAAALEGRVLTVRARQPGDRIVPTNLNGSKKIQDLYVDAKLPEVRRDTVPLIVCDDEVVWVPGYRVASRYAVPAPDAPSVRLTVHACDSARRDAAE